MTLARVHNGGGGSVLELREATDVLSGREGAAQRKGYGRSGLEYRAAIAFSKAQARESNTGVDQNARKMSCAEFGGR